MATHQLKAWEYPIKILICGLGSIGRRHSRIFHEMFPNIELSAYRSGHGPECPEIALMSHLFADLDAATKWKPDAAVICSPAPFHQYQALHLTRQGIPVLIEKPLGSGSESEEGWDELLHISTELPVVVGYVLRHDPCVAYIKEKLTNQELGKVLDADFYCGSWLPEWRAGQDYRECVSSMRSLGGGALLELSHEIDLACFFFNEFKITFSSLSKSGLLDIDVEDQVLLVGRSSICSQITIRLNFCTTPSRRSVIIRCEKGEICWDLINGNVLTSLLDQKVERFNSPIQYDDRYRLQAKRFLDCIYKGDPPCCSLNDGLRVLKLIKKAHSRADQESTKYCAFS